MRTTINGCNFSLNFKENELTNNYYIYTLPDGYSINIIRITENYNVYAINTAVLRVGERLVFPVINSKSPSTISLYINDLTKPARIRFTIEKFGQIPDAHYFDKPFDPILVTGDDGREYNVIPSDQFK